MCSFGFFGCRLTYGLLYYKKMNHRATFSLICLCDTIFYDIHILS